MNSLSISSETCLKQYVFFFEPAINIYTHLKIIFYQTKKKSQKKEKKIPQQSSHKISLLQSTFPAHCTDSKQQFFRYIKNGEKEVKPQETISFFFVFYINIFSFFNSVSFQILFTYISEFATLSKGNWSISCHQFRFYNIYMCFPYIYINLQLLHKTTLVFWRKLKGGCTPICFMWIRCVWQGNKKNGVLKDFLFELFSIFSCFFFYLWKKGWWKLGQ